MSIKLNEGIGCVEFKEHSYGVPDSMASLNSKVIDKMVVNHPLELSTHNFGANEDRLTMLGAKFNHGIHLPMRLKLEQQIVKSNSGHHMFLPSSKFSLDILNGSHETIDFSDVLNPEEFRENMPRPHDDLKIGFK